MKLKWIGDKLMVGGILVAMVERHYGGTVRRAQLLPVMDSFIHDTLEAAKAAAEKAVRDWFREVLGEPVAWAYFEDATGKMDGEPASTVDELNCGAGIVDENGEELADPGYTVHPLYALPSKEEGG